MNISDYRYTFDRLRHAILRYRLRSEIDAKYDELIERLDQSAFTERFRAHWDPFAGAGAAKYLTIDVWLREAIFRCLFTTAGLEPRGQIVDLGSGTGYFLWVCRELGYEILGVDLPSEPLYDACIDFFEIPRIEFRIEPMKPLCDMGRKTMMISAFMTCFDQSDDGSQWNVGAWDYFLTDVRARLSAGGRLAMKFNAQADTGTLYTRNVGQLFDSRSDFQCKRMLDYVLLTAR